MLNIAMWRQQAAIDTYVKRKSRSIGDIPMSIEIDIQTGDTSWPAVQPLFNTVWPAAEVAKLSWGQVKWANAEFRVMVEVDETIVAHVGLYRREATWDGKKIRIGGIGGVLTHPGHVRRGYATIALNAAIQTFKEERAIDFALLFCEQHNVAFYTARRWKPFEGDVLVEQPGGQVRFEAMAPFVFDLKRAPRQGVIDLCGLPW